MGYLGIDTSNYTTSVAVFRDSGKMAQQKALLTVSEGVTGLRQSDAVFLHVKQLGLLLEKLMAEIDETILAVGVSVSPRDEAGSYMPCFLAGKMAAQVAAAVLKTPIYKFSHQAGHIAAAIYDTKLDNLFEEDFLAFHVSGGTTQCLLVKPDDTSFRIVTIAQSLDLHAGQVIDRVGAMLGLGFPAGPALEKLACEAEKQYPIKIAFKGYDCCLSGVENQCRKLLDDGANPADIAGFCIGSVERAVIGMTERVTQAYPQHKLLYAGGVMSNKLIRKNVEKRFDAAFASPAFSADNAAGIAYLCKKSYQKEHAVT